MSAPDLAQLDAAIAILVAVRERVAHASETPPVVYIDQDDDDELDRRKLSRRTYLEAARAGAFEHEKRARKICTRVDILDRWLESRRRRPPPRLVVDNSIETAQAALDAAAARFTRRQRAR